MAAAGRLAGRLGLWSREEESCQNALLRRLGLPTAIPREMSADRIVEVMGHDKKNSAGAITLVLPVKMGEAACRQFTDTTLIRQVAEELK
jgi:3-dehydroquinate synthase